MARQFAHCDKCDDHMEAEYVKGKWYCENCGADLTAQVEANIKREYENKSGKTKRKRK